MGVKLFTILAFTDGGQTLHRIYSSHPQQYPVGGRKDVVTDVAADWVTRCRDEQAPYFGPTGPPFGSVFADSELIESLGCGSIVNVPMMDGEEELGALNILDAEGTLRRGADVGSGADDRGTRRRQLSNELIGELMIKCAPADRTPPTWTSSPGDPSRRTSVADGVIDRIGDGRHRPGLSGPRCRRQIRTPGSSTAMCMPPP